MWLASNDGEPSAALVAQHPGLERVRVASTSAANSPVADGRIYLIDPLGNWVLAWPADPDIKKRIANSAEGQYPKAVILSCLDSRVPVEWVFDQRIGDIFVGRVAGNIEDEDQLGSMEFATKLAGARLVMVLGSTHRLR